MRLATAVLFMFLFPSPVFGQELSRASSLNIDSATFTVRDPWYEPLCAGLAMKLGERPVSGMIRFKPKALLPTKNGPHKGVWVAIHGSKEVGFSSDFLPDSLYDLTEESVRGISYIICYTEKSQQFDVADLTITAISAEAAQRLASQIK